MSEETILRPEQNYGPGNVLRSKREEYEWSVDAVAEALHLSTSSVKAIEADRYEDLPGATYVMGYWRSYARLLGIDIEDTIEANKQNLNIVTAEASGMDLHRAFSHKKRGGSGGWLLFLIAAGVFAYFAWQPPQLFGLLEKMNTDQSPDPVEAPITPEPASPEAPDPAEKQPAEKNQVLRAIKKPAPSAPAITTKPKPLETASTTNLLESQAVVSGSSSGLVLNPATETGMENNSESNKLAGSALITPSKSAGSQAGPAVTTGVTTGVTTPVTTGAASGQSGDAGETESATSVAENKTVIFKLVKDTWLDVRDKSRKRLFYKTAKAGTEIEVTGMPPFYVLIQPPDGASVHYQGKERPFEAHKNGLYARFKLDDTLEPL